jgi:phage regulator Rha-like protein
MNTQIIPIERGADGALIVSSLTIAEGSGVKHKNVVELIRANNVDLREFGPLAFQTRKGAPLPQGGFAKSTEVAMLNEQQATLIMTYQRNTDQVRQFKLTLVKAFFEMAKQLQTPTAPAELSRMEILQLAMKAEQENLALNAELEIVRPKADYVERFVADNDYHLFRTVASDLMVGDMDLRWALVYSGWIYHDQQRRRNSKNEYVTEHLWSEYAAKKPYFFRAVNHQAPLFKGNVFYSLKVTAAGAAAIGRLVEKIAAEHGSLKAALPILEARYNERKTA